MFESTQITIMQMVTEMDHAKSSALGDINIITLLQEAESEPIQILLW